MAIGRSKERHPRLGHSFSPTITFPTMLGLAFARSEAQMIRLASLFADLRRIAGKLCVLCNEMDWHFHLSYDPTIWRARRPQLNRSRRQRGDPASL